MRGIEVLYDEDAIKENVSILGQEITNYYKSKNIDEILVLVVLKGALFFAADLMRSMRIPVRIECIRASSYGSSTVSSGSVKIQDHAINLQNQAVLIVDDILDTGRTLNKLIDITHQAGASDVKTCVFLDKRARRAVDINADYVGFTIPDEFVVGYGLDYDEMYRGLRYIGVLTND